MFDTRARWLVIGAAVATVAVVVYFLLPSEEDRVRARLQFFAETLSVPPSEPDLARLTRLVSVRKWFTESVVVDVAVAGGMTLSGREEIVGMVARLPVPRGGVTVEIVNVTIAIGEDGATADAKIETRVLARDPKDEPSTLDGRMVALTMRKIDGTWLVSHARVLPADDSLMAK